MQRHALRGAVWLTLLAACHLSCDSQSASSSSGGAAGRAAGGGAGQDPLGRGTGGVGAGAAAGSPAGVGGGGAGASGGQAGNGGAPGTPPPVRPSLLGSPIYTRVQRLTNAQWQRAVTDILRLDPPAAPLRATTGTAGQLAESLVVNPEAEVDFEAGSEAVAASATASAEALGRLYAGTDAAGFVRALGRRAFRRPLTAEEEQHYQAIFGLGESLYGAGFANGAALVIRAALVSPNFLYRSELGAAGEPLSGYEVAAKLSFWLLGTTPDDDLLDTAAAGGLDTVAGVEAATRAMLERPEAAAVMRDFHGQLYGPGSYAALDPARATDATRAELAEVSSRFFDAIFVRGESFRSIFTSPRFFVGPALAPLYGLASPPAAIEERTFDASGDASRAGYFTQVPFLLLTGAPNGESDPIARGVVLSSNVLCVQVAFHTDVPGPLPALMPGQTNRARVEAATAQCGSCHASMINPLGFAFEGFDGLGRARDLDNGTAVDTKASYPFAEGSRTFADARALMTLLADGSEAQGCYARGLATYALQRELTESDRSLVTDTATSARDRSLKEVIVSLARNPAFRLRAGGGP